MITCARTTDANLQRWGLRFPILSSGCLNGRYSRSPMTHGADVQPELERFFGGLTSAVDAERRRLRGLQDGLQQRIEKFFAGLTPVVRAAKERHRGPQREVDQFFDALVPVVRAEEDRRHRAAEDLVAGLARMFRLLEPTIAAATVAIGVMEERESEERDRRTGRKFLALNLVRLQELDLSGIFGGLLDPRGDHSQNELFLSLLLEELSASYSWTAGGRRNFHASGLKRGRMRLEHWTDKIEIPGVGQLPGSIDVVLELEGNRWIGIENKPWAHDQEWQVDRYLLALLKEVEARGGTEEQILLLYWSGDGSGPSLPKISAPPWSEEQKRRQEGLRSRCLTVPYRRRFGGPSVEGWIKRCRVECEADRVRLFLGDLLDYIQQVFTDTQTSTSDGE